MHCARMLAIVLCGGALMAEPPPFTNRERLRRYVHQLIGPAAVGRTTALSLFEWGRGRPPDWSQDADGFGRRLAWSYGRLVTQQTIELGAGAALGEDTRYFRMGEGSTVRRTWHALASTVIWHTPSGSPRPAWARLGGIYGGAMESMRWYPDRNTATGDGVRMANLQLAGTAAYNVFREFWPDIRNAFRRNKQP